MDELFYELIRVSIGVQDCLFHTPSADEWGKLYENAKKQSMIGICFAGLQRLGADAYEGFARIGMSEMLYLTWMGMAAKIQQRNQTVDEQCVELGERLKAEGYSYCILKGQGVGQLYTENLHGLRQSGDIDVYVEGGMKKVMKWCKRYEPSAKYDYVHTHLHVYCDTEVEVHYRYGCLYNLVRNHRLQKWFKEHEAFEIVELPNGAGSICVPSTEFNVVFLLHHIYRHLFVEGIGLRQVMDYFFILRNLKGLKGLEISKLQWDLKHLGMLKFASALMYVLKEVFGMESEYMICDPNEEEGCYLLDRIMETGNFGNKYGKVKKNINISKKWIRIVEYSMHIVLHYPLEALSAPFWHIYHFFWKRTLGRY